MRRSPPDEGARIVPILFRSLHLLLENRAARSPNRRWRANQAAELCPCCTGPAKRVGFVNGTHHQYRDVDHVSVGDYNHGLTDARYGWLDTQFHWHTLLKMAMCLVSATVNAVTGNSSRARGPHRSYTLFFGEDPAGCQSRAQSHTGMKSYATLESETMNTLHKVARRLLWWKTPEDALTVLAQVMTYGALSDVQAALERYGRTAFLETLPHAPPGVFDARCWRYWQLMFARPVPPLPVRLVTAGH